MIAQFEALKMNKVYNKNKETRTKKIEEKETLIENLRKKIKESKKDITLNKIKKNEFFHKTKVMFIKLENNLEEYTGKRSSMQKHVESMDQVNGFLRKISELTGRDIRTNKFDIEEANFVIKEYQQILIKNNSLERDYMNLVEAQDIHKKNYESLMIELTEFGAINGNLSLEISLIKQKSEILLQSNRLETYNQLLSALEDKPTSSRHKLSSSYENFAIYALLYIIQVVQRLINQIGYIENESYSTALKEMVDSIKERFNEFKKDSSIKRKSDSLTSEKSFTLFEKHLEFSLYQPPSSRNLFAELFQGFDEISTQISDIAIENIIIKHFTTPKEVKEFLKSLGSGISAVTILSSLPNLLNLGHKNLQSRILISNTILKALLISMIKQVEVLNSQIENKYKGSKDKDKELIKKRTMDMESLFSKTEANENVKSSDPFVKSILEHKRRQIRKNTRKNTFALKDEFEQYVQRFEILEPQVSKSEHDPRAKIIEEINELLFKQIPEQNEEEEKEDVKLTTPSNYFGHSKSNSHIKTRKKSDSVTANSLPVLTLTQRSFNFSKKQREENNRVVLKEIMKIENGIRNIKSLEHSSERNSIIIASPKFQKNDLLIKFPNINRLSNQPFKDSHVLINKSNSSVYSGSNI